MADEKEVLDEKVNETDQLPEGEKEETQAVPSEESSKLELENAELKGKVQAFEQIAKSTPKVNSTGLTEKKEWEALKNRTLSEMGSLTDEDFESKNGCTKSQAHIAILQKDYNELSASQKQETSTLRAENRLISQYPDFRNYQEAIDEAINDVAPEVKQDPDRLSKAMERAYLAAVKSEPKKRTEEKVERKSISSTSFEKPRPKVDRKEEDADAIPAEYAPICKAFGITSEKERKKYVESDEIETHFGGGYVLRDSKKGFEKVA